MAYNPDFLAYSVSSFGSILKNFNFSTILTYIAMYSEWSKKEF